METKTAMQPAIEPWEMDGVVETMLETVANFGWLVANLRRWAGGGGRPKQPRLTGLTGRPERLRWAMWPERIGQPNELTVEESLGAIAERGTGHRSKRTTIRAMARIRWAWIAIVLIASQGLITVTFPNPARAQAPPLLAEIKSATGDPMGEARIYQNYVEIADTSGTLRGAVGVVQVDGRMRLFVVKSDQTRTLIGWAELNRLYNTDGELAGYYYWTPTFSYVYDADLKKVGEARCLAYQGVCAAAIAGYLLGLL